MKKKNQKILCRKETIESFETNFCLQISSITWFTIRVLSYFLKITKLVNKFDTLSLV